MFQAPESQHAAARRSFEAAVLSRRAGLRAAARRFCRNDSDAEDLVQDTLLRAWCYWDSFHEGTNCRAWLHRILTTTYINGYRRRRREREVMGEYRAGFKLLTQATAQDPADAAVGDEVAQGLAQLPHEFRDVLWAVDVEGQSYREVAERVGCPVGTVMSRLHRARRRLRGGLEAHARSYGYDRDAA